MTTSTVTPAVPADQAAPAGQKAKRSSPGTVALLMLLPAAVLMITFLIIPILLTLGLAFTNARLISPEPATLHRPGQFRPALSKRHVLGVTPQHHRFRRRDRPHPVRRRARSGGAGQRQDAGDQLLPHHLFPARRHLDRGRVDALAVHVPAGWLINALLAKIGIQGPDWLGNPNTALFAIIVLSIWQACGMHMVIWLSGLQTIPGELYEAADLDGATKFQQFLHVTWPGLRATRTFILITITIAAFSLFAQVNIMTHGGPLDATTTLVFQAVRVGFEQQQTGYASAISLVFFILVLIVTMINRYLTRDKDVR